MESRNPIFARAEGFNARGSATGGQTYPGKSQVQGGYGDPSQWGTGTPGGSVTQVDRGPMTIDSVVQKTGITLGVVVVVAALTWVLTGEITTQAQLNGLYGISVIGALGGFGLAMVNTFKKVISPGLVLVYAVLQGVFVGGFSKALETSFARADSAPGGLVVGAVVGTMAAVAGTLAAYKFFNIKVGSRFYKWVVGAGMGFLAVTMLDLVLGFFGNSIGFNGFGPLGLIMSVIGLGLGVLFLILDFDQVERGIAAGLPERESWRAAFGLTATIVFIYIEILRILAILRGD
ncbi:MAG: rane protein [Marmoricola sp.]|nr:rane protein [Marmoricola sp.]